MLLLFLVAILNECHWRYTFIQSCLTDLYIISLPTNFHLTGENEFKCKLNPPPPPIPHSQLVLYEPNTLYTRLLEYYKN